MNFDKNIKEIEEIIGYEFSDKSLLRQAFTRTSFCNENKGEKGTKYQSNEVLEFFGDSVLSTAIITLLMHDKSRRYEYGISTELDEGDFSNIKSKLSDKSNLSRVAEALGLEKYLIMGEGDAKLGIWREPSVKEDLFESIIGAIYVDCNQDMRCVIQAVGRMLDTEEYTSREKVIQSYKNALQEFCADKKRRLPPPVYKTLSESGPEHKKEYERGCYIGDRLVGRGKGKNFKIADAAAAEAALATLKAETVKKDDTPPSIDGVKTLRAIAEREKKPSPEFRDLGETVRSNAMHREYEIECRFMGLISHGVAEDKREAKEKAARALLAILKPNVHGTSRRRPLPTKEENTADGHRKNTKTKGVKAPAEAKPKERYAAPADAEKDVKNAVKAPTRAEKSKRISPPKHQNKNLKQHRGAKVKRA